MFVLKVWSIPTPLNSESPKRAPISLRQLSHGFACPCPSILVNLIAALRYSQEARPLWHLGTLVPCVPKPFHRLYILRLTAKHVQTQLTQKFYAFVTSINTPFCPNNKDKLKKDIFIT